MNVEGIAIDKILVLFRQGKSIDYISEYYFISDKSKIIHRISEYITKYSLFEIYTERLKNINPAELYELRQKGSTNTDIAKIYNITTFQVKNIITKYCKNNNLPAPFYASKKLDLDIDEIERDYINGMPLHKIAQKHKTTAVTIKKRLLTRYSDEELNLFRNKKYFESFNNSKYLIKIYETGINMREIIEYCNVSTTLLYKVLSSHYGVPIGHIPRVMTLKTFSSLNVSNYNSIEIMQQNARKANRIIPSSLIFKYNGFKLDVNNIRKYIEKIVNLNKDDKDFTNQTLKDIDLSLLLKNKEYDVKHQITALLYNLPKTEYSSYPELIDLIGRRC